MWIDLLDPAEEDLFVRDPNELHQRVSRVSTIKWVVIDEVQKAPKLLNIVHDLIESRGMRFALTGSSARRLKQKGVNLLAGRAFTNYLYPLTSSELGEAFDLDEILQWGSLPKIFSNSSPAARAEYLRAYVLNFITYEIQAEQWVRKLEPFRKFLPIAGQMNGKVLNYAKIARELGVDTTTVISYFDILEDTLIGFRLEGYHKSLRKRQTKAPKFYLFDLGVRRALTRQLNTPLQRETYVYGDLFEHFVVCEAIRLNQYLRLDYEFSYLRTKDGAEIDLVIDRPGLPSVYVEIKSKIHVRREDTSTLKAFVQDNDCAEGYLLSQDQNAKLIDGIHCLPWQKGFVELGLAG